MGLRIGIERLFIANRIRQGALLKRLSQYAYYLDVERITNGAFDNTDDWEAQTNWLISGGIAIHSGTSDDLRQFALIADKWVKVTFDILVIDDGVCNIYDRTTFSTIKSYSNSGTKTWYAKFAGDIFALRSNSNNCHIDNVSVKEIRWEGLPDFYDWMITDGGYTEEDAIAELNSYSKILWGNTVDIYGNEFLGVASAQTVVPSFPFFNDLYCSLEKGYVLETYASERDILTWKGTLFGRKSVYQKSISANISVDVCIIGGGSSGMGAAYALKDRGYSVCLVEYMSELGGNVTQGGVTPWIAGNNPSYFQTIFNELKALGDASGWLGNSWVRADFGIANQGESLKFNKTALQNRYRSDVESDENFTLLTQHEVQDVYFITGTNVDSIVVRDRITGNEKTITASWFIDTSTDASVVRRAQAERNVDFYFGEDPQSRFNESLAPVNEDLSAMNEISQIFKIQNSYDDSSLLNSVTTVYLDSNGDVVYPSYLLLTTGFPDASTGEVNAMNGVRMTGDFLLKRGIELSKSEARKRTIEYWKAIKLTLQKLYDESGSQRYGAWHTDYRNWGFLEFSELPGYRETVRINCERMLTQNDLEVLVSSTTMTDVIAYGSHIIDFHVYGGKSASAIATFNSTNLKPSAIFYSCLIPKNLTNVLVAGRCFGASQIALAARRVSKDMMSLGWAAGHAIRYCLENGLTDTRNVDVTTIQGSGYTGIYDNIVTLESKLA